MNIVCRKARPDDVEQLDLVMQVISDGPGDYAIMKRLIEKIDRNEEKYLMVAEDTDSGKVVGSLLGVVFEDICGDGSPILLVENVAVLESAQGQGVGRMMFQEVERWAREFHCHYEMLVSGLTRQGAHKFYKALGFEEVKGFKKYL